MSSGPHVVMNEGFTLRVNAERQVKPGPYSRHPSRDEHDGRQPITLPAMPNAEVKPYEESQMPSRLPIEQSTSVAHGA